MSDKKTYTPEQIDDLCIAFDNTCIALESAQREHSTAKGNLLAAVQGQGVIAPRADKTTRLVGVLYVADSTTGSTVEINEAAVGELRSELSRLKKPRVFADLFKRTVKHALLKDASETLKVAIGGFGEEVQMRLLGIYATCFKVETKSPSLKVNLVSALQKKEEEAAAKAAAKAAKSKKSGKAAAK